MTADYRSLNPEQGSAIAASQHRSAVPSGLSRFASHRFARLPTIARAALGCSLIFLFTFGLPGLLAGV